MILQLDFHISQEVIKNLLHNLFPLSVLPQTPPEVTAILSVDSLTLGHDFTLHNHVNKKKKGLITVMVLHTKFELD